MKNWIWALLLCVGLASPASAQLSQTNWGPATVDAANEELKFTDLRGMGSASVQLSGTWSATFTPACSNDEGTTWDAVTVFDGSGTAFTTVTSNGRYTADVSGCDQFRLRATAYTSGTATLNGVAKPVNGGAAGGGGAVTVTSGTVTVDNLAQDAVEGGDALTTGPQLMAYCETTAPSAASDGKAYKLRADCASQALYVRFVDPCASKAKTYYVVNMSTATTNEIANAVSSEFFYICSVNLVAAGAQTVAIGEDDTDGCGSITAGLHGGATAATGWSFAANGGISLGNGLGTVMKTATAARYLCIITGQAQQISGTISYVSAGTVQ